MKRRRTLSILLIDAYHKLRYMQWVAAHSTSVLGVPFSQAYLHTSSHGQTNKTMSAHSLQSTCHSARTHNAQQMVLACHNYGAWQ